MALPFLFLINKGYALTTYESWDPILQVPPCLSGWDFWCFATLHHSSLAAVGCSDGHVEPGKTWHEPWNAGWFIGILIITYYNSSVWLGSISSPIFIYTSNNRVLQWSTKKTKVRLTFWANNFWAWIRVQCTDTPLRMFQSVQREQCKDLLDRNSS